MKESLLSKPKPVLSFFFFFLFSGKTKNNYRQDMRFLLDEICSLSLVYFGFRGWGCGMTSFLYSQLKILPWDCKRERWGGEGWYKHTWAHTYTQSLSWKHTSAFSLMETVSSLSHNGTESAVHQAPYHRQDTAFRKMALLPILSLFFR